MYISSVREWVDSIISKSGFKSKEEIEEIYDEWLELLLGD